MNASPTSPDDDGDRVAKVMARAGLCSRREAERWIAEGRVALNGTVLVSPAVIVRPGDTLVVDGVPVPQAERTRLWRYHKPAGLVTTRADPQGRPTVFERLPAGLPRVISIGRLDITSEGLLLLTNDGELSRRLELPSTGWARRYRVRVHGTVDPDALKRLADGVTVEGVTYGPIEATLERVQGSNAWLSVTLREGKNREVRRVMESLGLAVTRLIRTAYGPFQLGLLEPGQVEEVRGTVLRDQVGTWLAAHEAGVVRTAAAGAGTIALSAATAPSRTAVSKPTASKPTASKPPAAKPGRRTTLRLDAGASGQRKDADPDRKTSGRPAGKARGKAEAGPESRPAARSGGRATRSHGAKDRRRTP